MSNRTDKRSMKRGSESVPESLCDEIEQTIQKHDAPAVCTKSVAVGLGLDPQLIETRIKLGKGLSFLYENERIDGGVTEEGTAVWWLAD